MLRCRRGHGDQLGRRPSRRVDLPRGLGGDHAGVVTARAHDALRRDHRADVTGDVATGQTYCFAHHVASDNDHIMAIDYHDEYRRTSDGWKFGRRELFIRWTTDLAVKAALAG